MRRTSIVALATAISLFVIGCSSTTTTTTTSAPAAVTSFTADLSGAEAVPPNQSTATGEATFMLSSDGSSMTFELSVTDLSDAAAAHIHMGPAGTEGPVLVALFGGPAQAGPFTGVLATGAFTAADFGDDLKGKAMSDLVSLIQSGDAYVNVHTAAFKAGEIRGQMQ